MPVPFKKTKFTAPKIDVNFIAWQAMLNANYVWPGFLPGSYQKDDFDKDVVNLLEEVLVFSDSSDYDEAIANLKDAHEEAAELIPCPMISNAWAGHKMAYEVILDVLESEKKKAGV